MRYQLQQFKELIPDLSWGAQELADKLSAIGHEAEVNDGALDVTLTSNRKDCKELQFLIFDLAGIYGLTMINPPSGFDHGPVITVTVADINKILGSNIDYSKLKELERLGFIVTEAGVQPPDFRDVATRADVAEEVVRLIGFDALTIEPLSNEAAPPSPDFDHIMAVKFALVAAGWTETATNSFSAEGEVELKNPFTDTEPFLRRSLQRGLLQTLAKNPFMKRAKFFEIGDIFGDHETIELGLIISGYKDPSLLSDQLSETLGQTIILTQIDPNLAAKLEAKQGNIYYAQIDCSDVIAARTTTPLLSLPNFTPISKYPPLVRDVTIVGGETESSRVIETVKGQFPQLLLAEVIDQYTNPETNSSSVTIRFIFQKMDASFAQGEIDVIAAQLNDFLK